MKYVEICTIVKDTNDGTSSVSFLTDASTGKNAFVEVEVSDFYFATTGVAGKVVYRNEEDRLVEEDFCFFCSTNMDGKLHVNGTVISEVAKTMLSVTELGRYAIKLQEEYLAG